MSIMASARWPVLFMAMALTLLATFSHANSREVPGSSRDTCSANDSQSAAGAISSVVLLQKKASQNGQIAMRSVVDALESSAEASRAQQQQAASSGRVAMSSVVDALESPTKTSFLQEGAQRQLMWPFDYIFGSSPKPKHTPTPTPAPANASEDANGSNASDNSSSANESKAPNKTKAPKPKPTEKPKPAGKPNKTGKANSSEDSNATEGNTTKKHSRKLKHRKGNATVGNGSRHRGHKRKHRKSNATRGNATPGNASKHHGRKRKHIKPVWRWCKGSNASNASNASNTSWHPCRKRLGGNKTRKHHKKHLNWNTFFSPPLPKVSKNVSGNASEVNSTNATNGTRLPLMPPGFGPRNATDDDDENSTDANETEDQGCHTALAGETCYQHVIWAMHVGVDTFPKWFPNLTVYSTFADFQKFIANTSPRAKCAMPCPMS